MQSGRDAAEHRPYPQPGNYVVWRGTNFIAHAAPSYWMTWRGRRYYVEWHPYFGPSRLRKDGELYLRQPGERHPFWDGVTAWQNAGLQADDECNAIMEAVNV